MCLVFFLIFSNIPVDRPTEYQTFAFIIVTRSLWELFKP